MTWVQPIRLKRSRIAPLVAGLVVFTATPAVPAGAASPAVEHGRHLFHDGDFGSPLDTGVPYAFFVALMDRYPGVLARDWDDLASRYGVLKRESPSERLPVGFALRKNFLTGTPFLMTNCALCHQGEIAGKRIEGIGNRNLRLNAMNNAIASIGQRADFTASSMVAASRAAAKREGVSWSWRSDFAARKATEKIKERSAAHVELDSGPGRNTPIEFAKIACGVPVTRPFGYVKFPAVWMFKQRATLGYDASFEGDPWLTPSAVEFNKGMSPGAVLAQPKTWHDLYAYLASLEAPRFPGPIDRALAARGEAVYASYCADCHGEQGARYEEHLVPLEEVGTDPDRVHSLTPELILARNRTPLGKHTPLVKKDGYVAPPLEGIWARAPYLHNGSVPTLVDLLRPPPERPDRFPVAMDVPYDLETIGLARQRAADSEQRPTYDFDVNAPGGSNDGHAFGTRMTAEKKSALLEFLKTL